MTQNKLKRYERKWVFNSTNVLFIINALLRSKFLFNFQYEKRKVNSMYFDDQNYSSIRENLDGVSEKKKYINSISKLADNERILEIIQSQGANPIDKKIINGIQWGLLD